MDAWDDKVAQLFAGGKAEEDSSAEWRVAKIITGGDSVALLDEEHGTQLWAAEATIVERVQKALIAKYTDGTHRNT